MTPARPATREYWESSRARRYSLLLVLPLAVAYEVLATLLARDASVVRNGADAMLRALFSSALGAHGPLVLGLVLIAACVFFIARDMRKSGADLRGWVFGCMLLEAAALAAVFGVVVATVTVHLLEGLTSLAISLQPRLSGADRLMVSLGAGVYEELLFRVLLVSVVTLVLRAGLGWTPRNAALVAVVVSATVFSAFHYIGPLGDVFRTDSFVFRLIAGVFFSGLYVLRGFGITAWTHALYDVYLLF